MHRFWSALLGMVLCYGCQPSAEVSEEPATETAGVAFLDPIVADGEHYMLEFENDFVRVLREKLSGGDGGAMHSHRQRVSVYLNDAEVTLTPKGGEPMDSTLVAGTTSWSGPTTHQGFARSAIENLSIELEDLTGDEIPLPEPDAVEVDPDHHVVDFENDLVRVVRMTYPPGFKTPPHLHRRGFGVFLTDAHAQNLPEEGEPVTIEAEARSTFWTDSAGPPHVTENLGTEPLVVLLVEMKKQP